MSGRAWTFYDRRSGKRATSQSYKTLDLAQEALDRLKKQSRGDDRRLSLYLEIVELTPDTWGSMPGEIIKEVKA
jgi:hypothetical protein